MDQSAASEAVSRGLAMVGGTPRDPAQVVAQQMGLAVRTSIDRIVTRLKQIRNAVSRGIAIKKLKRWLLKYFSRFRDPKYRPGNYKI